MIEFVITIQCENDAFFSEPMDTWDPAPELTRLLRVAANRIEREGIESSNMDFPLIDSNGNRVGNVRFFDPHMEQR